MSHPGDESPSPAHPPAATIGANAARLARAIVARQRELQPDLEQRYASALDAWSDDTAMRLRALGESVAVDCPELFSAQIAWSRDAYAAVGGRLDDLEFNLHAAREVIQESFPPTDADRFSRAIDQGLRSLRAPEESPTGTPPARPVQEYLLALLEGRRADASDLALSLLRSGRTIDDIAAELLAPAMREVGRLWQTGEIGVHEEHYATAATAQILTQLALAAQRAPSIGKVVLCAGVEGDLHELGIRMVSDAFERAGWTSQLLGANVPRHDLVEALFAFRADVLALSARLIYHVGAATRTIAAIRADKRTRAIPIIVGGLPFDLVPDLWNRVGAQAHARSAAQAIALAESLVPTR